MPEPVAIQERILRVHAITLATATGLTSANVHRWDTKGVDEYPPGDCVFTVTSVRAAEGGDGNIGYTRKTMSLLSWVILAPDESGTKTTQEDISRWCRRLEAVLAGAWSYTEAGGTRLALDSHTTECSADEIIDGKSPAAVMTEVTFDHLRTDPSQGPGIAQVTE